MPRTYYPGTKGRLIESQIVRKQKRSAARRQRYNMASSGVTRSELMQIVKANSGETKYFDVGIATAVTWSGATWADSEVPADNYVNANGASAGYTDSCLIPTANGSGYGQVVGTKYHLKAIRVRGQLSIASSTGGTATSDAVKVRLLLVEDTQPNGSQAQGEDILQDIGGAPENMNSFLRIPNALGRFRIVKDKMIMLQPAITVNNAAATSVSTSFESRPFKINFSPKKPIEVNIKASSTTPTISQTINRNYFLLLAGLDVPNGSVKSVTIAAASRAYYND